MKTTLFLAVLFAITAFAQIPNKISYQGLLTTSSGTPLPDGSYELEFKIFNAPINGLLQFTETHTGVPVERGTFGVILGSVTTLPAIFSESLYVEVKAVSGPGIGSPVTFSPRSPLTSAPYALAPWATSDSNVYYRSGNVGIGTTSPTTKLEVLDSAASSSPAIIGRHAIVSGFSEYGTGVQGVGFEKGVHGIAAGSAGNIYYGVYGEGSTSYPTYGATYGIYGSAQGGFEAHGVSGTATSSVSTASVYGLKGSAQGGLSTYGLSGNATSSVSNASAFGVRGHADAPNGTGYGVYGGATGPNSWAGYFAGKGYFGSNVGIGTTVPAEMLDVNGNLKVSGKATIGPGHSNTGQYAAVSGGSNNRARGYLAVVCGGGGPDLEDSNSALGDRSFIGGGMINRSSGNLSTVVGGSSNMASGQYATVSGGVGNTASQYGSTVSGGVGSVSGGDYALVAGGIYNVAYGDRSSVGGGQLDSAIGSYSTVPGGSKNKASGAFSFAAGRKAKAVHPGTFVWADGNDLDFWSSDTNEFSARSTGGARFVSAIDIFGNPTAGVSLAPGGGSWSSISDRNLKTNFLQISGNEVLAKLAELPIMSWNYKSQERSIRHIGPMAQDFYAAFGYGEDETHITTIDVDGVALAAIKELHRRNVELTARVVELEDQLRSLLQGTR